MMCGCWPPAGSRCGWPVRPGTGWRRWPCRIWTTWLRRRGRRRWRCSRTGPGTRLAIELAAAQVEALGVTGLLSRLDERLALLAGADRLAPSRQRSLAATVAWSYQLLDEAERRA